MIFTFYFPLVYTTFRKTSLHTVRRIKSLLVIVKNVMSNLIKSNATNSGNTIGKALIHYIIA